MKIFEVAALVEKMAETPVTPNIAPQEAYECMRVLGDFNGCLLGLVHFSGQTGWERHAEGDELLFIIEGETEVTQLTPDGEVHNIARKGDAVQIPAGVWHSQRTHSPVKLMFLTMAKGSESSPSRPAV